MDSTSRQGMAFPRGVQAPSQGQSQALQRPLPSSCLPDRLAQPQVQRAGQRGETQGWARGQVEESSSQMGKGTQKKSST